ncbi:MAG: MFS transporter [Kiritimatiellaceae bacterium]|nr:MFS transporter [Kiritimatiellaceae bacterium]
MMTHLKNRLTELHPDMKFFLAAVIAFGFGSALVDSIFNNFLDERFNIDGLQRTLLEVPRELPGLSVAFVSALLSFLPSRRMAALSGFLGCIGLITLTLFSHTFYWMMPWLFLFSLGQHIYLPLNQGIAMELANKNQAGRRLGQISALRNAAAIAGSALVFLGFQYLHFTFTITLLLAAVSLLTCGFCFYKMVPDQPHTHGMHLKLYKEYRLYYLLAILFGTRKQIFLTFAPWVLVTIYHQPTSMIAQLLTLGGLVGIAIQPLIGRMIDHKGERFTLSLEALLLIVVCAGYAFARDHAVSSIAFLIAAGCFLLDQTLMSFNIARSTYMKKIALDASHITPTLTMAVTIDHVFSISIALLGGLLWRTLGYQSVFCAGIVIAIISWFVAQRIERTARPAC